MKLGDGLGRWSLPLFRSLAKRSRKKGSAKQSVLCARSALGIIHWNSLTNCGLRSNMNSGVDDSLSDSQHNSRAGTQASLAAVAVV